MFQARKQPLLTAIGWLLLWPGLSACQPDLPRISLVNEMDLLGHRVEVESDPRRATPRPGETGRIQWQVIYPEIRDDNDEDLSVLAVECTMPERYVGRPICEEILKGELMDAVRDLMPQAESETPGDGAGLRFRCTDDTSLPLDSLTLHCLRGHTDTEFTVPEDYARSARLFTGIVCRHGIAELSESGFGCTENDDGEELEVEEFLSSVPVQTAADERNRNPDADALSLKLDGRPWPEWDGPQLPRAQDCDDGSDRLPTLTAGEEVALLLAYAADDRERVDGKNEQLRISHRATAGTFDSSVTYLARDLKPDGNGDLVNDTQWIAPKAEEKGEQVIRFYFGIRDGRGGFATTERFACRP